MFLGFAKAQTIYVRTRRQQIINVRSRRNKIGLFCVSHIFWSHQEGTDASRSYRDAFWNHPNASWNHSDAFLAPPMNHQNAFCATKTRLETTRAHLGDTFPFIQPFKKAICSFRPRFLKPLGARRGAHSLDTDHIRDTEAEDTDLTLSFTEVRGLSCSRPFWRTAVYNSWWSHVVIDAPRLSHEVKYLVFCSGGNDLLAFREDKRSPLRRRSRRQGLF